MSLDEAEKTEEKTVVQVGLREKTVHPELIDDHELAPPSRVLKEQLGSDSGEHSQLEHLKRLDQGVIPLLERSEEEQYPTTWKVGEQALEESDRSVEHTLSNLPPKSESQITKTSYNLPRWLIDAFEQVEENHSSNLSWRDLTRGITKKANVLLYSKSHPGEVREITSAIRDLKDSVSIPGLHHYLLSSEYTYDKDQTKKTTFGIENPIYQQFSKLANRLSWDKTQMMVFALCLGLTASDTLRGKAVYDRVEEHADSGLEEFETARKVGKRQYRVMLDHIANEQLTREKQRRVFRQLKETHDHSEGDIPPEKLWVDLWYTAVVEPTPIDGTGTLDVTVFNRVLSNCSHTGLHRVDEQ